MFFKPTESYNDFMKKRKHYYYLPTEYQKAHDYCEYVLFQIEELILNNTFVELEKQSLEFTPEFMKVLEKSDEHILDLLQQHQQEDAVFHIVKNTMLRSLIIDTCYFLQEGFLCSLKMRLTVSFTLFRKPFLEILIVLMRVLCEKSFILDFNSKPNFDPIKTTPSRKRELIQCSNEKLMKKFVEDDIFDYIFNKDFGDSLFNISNHAIHLYTDRNPVSKTVQQNLNFIFSNTHDIKNQWDYIYNTLPMLVSFIADLIDLLVFKSTRVDEKVFVRRLRKREKMRRLSNLK